MSDSTYSIRKKILCSLNQWNVFLICWIRRTDCDRRLWIGIRPNHLMQPECTRDGSAVKRCSVKLCITSAFLLVLHCVLPICLLGTRSEIQLVQCVNLPFGAEAGI